MKYGFLWICIDVLSSGWSPDMTLQLFPLCEHWWTLRREFSKTSWEIGNCETPPLPHFMLESDTGLFRFCWFMKVRRGETWAHWHRQELNVLCLTCVVLGHRSKTQCWFLAGLVLVLLPQVTMVTICVGALYKIRKPGIYYRKCPAVTWLNMEISVSYLSLYTVICSFVLVN